MIVEAANPAHSLADSKRIREALARARHRRRHRRRDDRDGAARRTTSCRRRRSSRRPRRRSSTSNFPRTTSTCAGGSSRRPRARCPRRRSTRASPRRSARSPRPTWRRSARRGRRAGSPPTPHAFMARVMPDRAPRRAGAGAPLPHARRCPTSCARARSSSASALRCAMQHPAVARARRLRRLAARGGAGALRRDPGRARRASCSPSTNGRTCSAASGRPTARSTSRCPTCSTSSASWSARRRPRRTRRFPFVLSAGERRSFTANTIIRDPVVAQEGREAARCASARATPRRSASRTGDARAARRRGAARSSSPSRSPTRCSAATSRCRTGSASPTRRRRRDRRRAERAHRARGSRSLRRDAVAQARRRADRGDRDAVDSGPVPEAPHTSKQISRGLAWIGLASTLSGVLDLAAQVILLQVFISRRRVRHRRPRRHPFPLLDQATDMGLSSAVIQRDDHSPEKIDTVFWLNVIMSLAVFAVLAARRRRSTRAGRAIPSSARCSSSTAPSSSSSRTLLHPRGDDEARAPLQGAVGHPHRRQRRRVRRQGRLRGDGLGRSGASSSARSCARSSFGIGVQLRHPWRPGLHFRPREAAAYARFGLSTSASQILSTGSTPTPTTRWSASSSAPPRSASTARRTSSSSSW